MGNNHKKTDRSVAYCIIAGTTLGILISVVLSGILAAMINAGRMGESMMKPGVVVILFLSSCSGCVLAANLGKDKIALQCSVTGASYIALLISVNIVFFDAVFTEWGIKLLSVILGVLVACVLCARGKKKRRNR